MRIPDSFKAAQAAVFQDKTIAWHAAEQSIGSLGGVYQTPAEEATASYSDVNVQVLSDALLAQEYGLVVGRDILITRSTSLPIPQGDFINWEGATYRVVTNIAHDSHCRLLGEKVNL